MTKPLIAIAVLLSTILATISNCHPLAGTTTEAEAGAKPAKTMRPFSSEQELKDHFKKLAEKQKGGGIRTANANMAASTDAVSGSPVAEGQSLAKAKVAKEDDSVTNTQHAGVDEGGIVKVHGNYLVVLRRGRLFTIRIGDESLRPVDAVNAYAPGIDPSDDWYDEMLISGNTLVVIGYSYGRGGTEINLFGIDGAGDIDYRSTYHLRSNDYYSSRNYASRLIGEKLIFYTPQFLGLYSDPLAQFPAVRRWRKGARDTEFKRVVNAVNVYRPEKAVESAHGMALHTVTVCDLSGGGFACKASAVLGAPGRVFYVSPNSVYVWTTDWNYGGGKPKSSSMLYKMPLDASAPSAIGVTGGPVDQFSFLESEDNHINVLVRADGRGEQMWGSEVASGDVAMFRMPIDGFSDGSEVAPHYRYREVPKPEGYTFQNRFVGRFMLYGTGSGWGRAQKKDAAELFAVDYVAGDVHELRLKHGVDRIEQLGDDAVVIGTNGQDLHFSPVELGSGPAVREGYVRKNATQGELRSHGFFYKPNGNDSGLLGLPIAREGRPGYRHLVEGSAAVIFLRNNRLDFSELGELEARNASANDRCKASCVDWYGNARPLFLRNRIFALLGYELVEGSVSGNRIREVRRINYSPGFARRERVE